LDGAELIIGLLIGFVAGAIVLLVFYSRRVESIAQQRIQMVTEALERRSAQEMQNLRATVQQGLVREYEAKLESWRRGELAKAVEEARADALQRSRFTLKGKIGEQLAPFLPEFLSHFDPSDARFIGSPIDYVVFKNLSKVESEGLPIVVYLIDIKTGAAVLNKNEKMVKEAVDKGAVRFTVIRLPETELAPAEAGQSSRQADEEAEGSLRDALDDHDAR